jgi:TM2 domain-containing membrane protein YozV
MRKFIFIFFSLLLSLNTFAVDFQIVGETSTTKRIAISPNDKNHENLQWLADYFHEQNKKENQAYVLIYDNIKAAQMYDRLNDLSDSESEFYDNHFIGTFWKGAGDTSRYDFTFMLDGLNGKTESIKYDRKDDVEKTEEIADEKEIVETRTSSSNTNEIDPFTKTIYILVWVFLIGDIFLLINWKRWRGKKWFDFFVVFFLGMLGVQKFREKKIGWGILYLFTCGLYFIGWLVDCIRYFIYAYTGKKPEQKVATEISNCKKEITAKAKLADLINGNAPLPVVSKSNIILQDDEVCHFYDFAWFTTTSQVKIGRVSNRGGRSSKFLGVRFSTGQTYSQNVYKTVKEHTDGYLAITNKRIIFFAPKGSFDKSIKSLTAFSLCDYDTGLAFQFGSMSIALAVNKAKYANAILTRIINSGKTI